MEKKIEAKDIESIKEKLVILINNGYDIYLTKSNNGLKICSVKMKKVNK